MARSGVSLEYLGHQLLRPGSRFLAFNFVHLLVRIPLNYVEVSLHLVFTLKNPALIPTTIYIKDIYATCFFVPQIKTLLHDSNALPYYYYFVNSGKCSALF
jgi:hypothetical protein